MRIGFNLLPYSDGSHGGSEVYLRSLARELVRDGRDEVVAVLDVGSRFLTASSRGRFLRIVAEQVLLPKLVRIRELDCLVSNYVVPLLARCPQVVVIHDMLCRRHSDVLEQHKLLYWRLMIPLSIRSSSAVVTVSRFSASELRAFYPAAGRKLFLTGEGVRLSLAQQPDEGPPRALAGRDYLLCVATFGKHKNLHTLVEAFAALARNYTDLSLVLVGAARTPDAQRYRHELVQQMEAENVSSRVVFTDHVTDRVMASFYANAAALVLPSKYEGFGLPVIEAQHFGCPVLCSDRTSLPEVAGEAALFFDPDSAESIANAITMIMRQPELREDLRVRGRSNVKRFSWQKAAQQLTKAIEFAVKGTQRYV